MRGSKRDLQLFPGHCLHTTIVCYLLPPLPPPLSPLHLPSFSCPIPQSALSFPFSCSLPKQAFHDHGKGRNQRGFCHHPYLSRHCLRIPLHLASLGELSVRAQCHDMVAMWALRPHQQTWTWLPSQPTGNNVRGWLLVRSSAAMSWWRVPEFPKMHDLNRTVRMKEAQL